MIVEINLVRHAARQACWPGLGPPSRESLANRLRKRLGLEGVRAALDHGVGVALTSFIYQEILQGADSERSFRERRTRLVEGIEIDRIIYERIDAVMPMVVKKDGRREPWDRAKLEAGEIIDLNGNIVN